MSYGKLLEPESLAMLITFLFNPSRKEAVVTDLDTLKSGNLDVNSNASVHRLNHIHPPKHTLNHFFISSY